MKRESVLGRVGGVPVANPYCGGDLEKMTAKQLSSRWEKLRSVDESDTDSDETFMGRQTEINAIEEELKRRQGTLKDIKCMGCDFFEVGFFFLQVVLPQTLVFD